MALKRQFFGVYVCSGLTCCAVFWDQLLRTIVWQELCCYLALKIILDVRFLFWTSTSDIFIRTYASTLLSGLLKCSTLRNFMLFNPTFIVKLISVGSFETLIVSLRNNRECLAVARNVILGLQVALCFFLRYSDSRADQVSNGIVFQGSILKRFCLTFHKHSSFRYSRVVP